MAMRMNSRIRIEGDDRILANLRALGEDIFDEAEEALEEGAELLQEYARQAAPGPTGREHGRYPHPPGTLKNSIQVGYVRRGRGRIGIKVGIARNRYFTQEDKFYARFQEFGTSKMIAQPFMRPALKRNRAKIRRLVQQKMREALFR